MENEKIDSMSSCERDLFWTIAGPKPKLLSKLKKEINTITIATTPNSAGVRRRASTALIIMLITTLLYFDIAV